MLTFLSYLAPGHCPRRVLGHAATEGGTPLAEVIRDRPELSEALATLRDVSLIRLMDEEVFVHQLVQVLVRERQPAAARARWIDAACRAVAAEMVMSGHTYPHWARLEVVARHADAVLDFANQHEVSTPAVATLRFGLGRYRYDRGVRAEGRTLLDRAMRDREQLLGPDSMDTVAAMNAYSRCLRNDLSSADSMDESVALSKRAFETGRQQGGDTHRETVRAANCLAMALYHAGNLQKARHHGEWALNTAKVAFGPDDPDVYEYMTDVGMILRAIGYVDAACEMAREAKAGFERLPGYGREHPLCSSAWNNLAFALRDRGDLDAAFGLTESLYQSRLRTLGPDHPSTLIAENNHALVLRDQDKLEQALAVHQRVLHRRRTQLGESHRSTLISMSHVGVVQFRLGHLEEARSMLETVLRARQRMGAQTQSTLTSMVNLADVLLAMGDFDEAGTLYGQALEIRSANVGEDSRDTATCMFGLASVYARQGRQGEALAMHERALAVRQRLLGHSHAETAASKRAVQALRDTMSVYR